MSALINVYCKLPNGIELKLNPKERGVLVKGLNSTVIPNLFTYQQDHAATEVPKEIWDQWYAKNKGLSFVRDGFLWATEKIADGAAQAKEKKALKTGLEPLVPQAEESASTPGTATKG